MGVPWLARRSRPNRNSEQQQINICIDLGKFHPDEVESLSEGLTLLEKYKDSDVALEEEYQRICEELDRAYQYIRTKPRKPTRLQSQAKAIIMRVRNGCQLCGLLGGSHTDKCLELSRQIRP
jgi:chromosome segregation ATPase